MPIYGRPRRGISIWCCRFRDGDEYGHFDERPMPKPASYHDFLTLELKCRPDLTYTAELFVFSSRATTA